MPARSAWSTGACCAFLSGCQRIGSEGQSHNHIAGHARLFIFAHLAVEQFALIVLAVRPYGINGWAVACPDHFQGLPAECIEWCAFELRLFGHFFEGFALGRGFLGHIPAASGRERFHEALICLELLNFIDNLREVDPSDAYLALQRCHQGVMVDLPRSAGFGCNVGHCLFGKHRAQDILHCFLIRLVDCFAKARQIVD